MTQHKGTLVNKQNNKQNEWNTFFSPKNKNVEKDNAFLELSYHRSDKKQMLAILAGKTRVFKHH